MLKYQKQARGDGFNIIFMGSKTKIEKLKQYFEKRDDVVMAFLFGSQAKGVRMGKNGERMGRRR